MIRWGTRTPWALEVHLCACDARVILGGWWLEWAWIPGAGVPVRPSPPASVTRSPNDAQIQGRAAWIPGTGILRPVAPPPPSEREP